MKHILKATEVNNSKGKYLYEVINVETGSVVATRHSNRVYAAATRTGGNFFGRVDLAQKTASSEIDRVTSNVNGYYSDEEKARTIAFWTDIAYVQS